jgi:hypothetical protein
LAYKYRNIEINQSMDTKSATTNKGGKTMELLVPLGIFAVWIILQAWVLPRLAVKT